MLMAGARGPPYTAAQSDLVRLRAVQIMDQSPGWSAVKIEVARGCRQLYSRSDVRASEDFSSSAPRAIRLLIRVVVLGSELRLAHQPYPAPLQ